MADFKLSALPELLAFDDDADLFYVGDVSAGASKRATLATLKGIFLVETDIAAKGDLFVGLANDSIGVLAVGLNDQVLTADSTTGTGVKWATLPNALLESEVDIDIKTLVLPANTTISAFGATLVDDIDAAAARTTLGITPGIPAGGTATQVLTKNSGTDYDVSWAAAPGGGSGLTEAQVRTRAFVRC